MKKYILKLSTNQDYFRIDVPDDDETFIFDLDNTRDFEIATQMLQIDATLANIRFYLVPRFISEDTFWRAYFYCIHLILNTHSISAIDEKLEKLTEKSKHKHLELLRELDKDFMATVQAVHECLEMVKNYISQEIDRRNASAEEPFEQDEDTYITASSVEKKMRECVELKKKISVLSNDISDSPDVEDKLRDLSSLFTILMTQYDSFKQACTDDPNSPTGGTKYITFNPKLLDTTRDPASVTTSIQRQKICAAVLPQRYRIKNWRLLYSSLEHGVSIHSFYRKAKEETAALLIIQTDKGGIFGTFGGGFQINGHYYGTGEQSVFTFCAPKGTEQKNYFENYPWSKKNDYFQRSTDSSIAVGGGLDGKAAIWIDGDFLHGASHPCQTFDNKPLNGVEEDFKIYCIELWGFEDVSKRNYKPVK